MTITSKPSIIFCIFLTASCAKPGLTRQESTQEGAGGHEQTVKNASSISWRTQFRVPKSGDTWKYQVDKGISRTFSVVGLIETSSLVPGDIMCFGTPQFEVTTNTNGHVTKETKVISFIQDAFDSTEVRIIEFPENGVSYSVGTMSGDNVILWLPLYLDRHWMWTFFVGSEKVTWTYTVTNFYESFKVGAGTFHKVWQVHKVDRVNDKIEPMAEGDYYYAEQVGLLKQTENVKGALKTRTWLELTSYKTRR